MAAVGLFSNVFAGDVHLEGCDYELETYQNLATYGLFHVTPDPGCMYVRVILKVHNVSDSPKTIFFDDVMIRDEAGRTYSCCGFGFGRNPISTIQPGFGSHRSGDFDFRPAPAFLNIRFNQCRR